LRLVQSA